MWRNPNRLANLDKTSNGGQWWKRSNQCYPLSNAREAAADEQVLAISISCQARVRLDWAGAVTEYRQAGKCTHPIYWICVDALAVVEVAAEIRNWLHHGTCK